MEQLSLFDLLTESHEESHADRVRRLHWEWLLDVRKVGLECKGIFDRLMDTIGYHDAFERTKCLDVMSGERKVEGWSLDDASLLGLFDQELDYHVCWDRAHAARMGWSKEDVAKLERWEKR